MSIGIFCKNILNLFEIAGQSAVDVIIDRDDRSQTARAQTGHGFDREHQIVRCRMLRRQAELEAEITALYQIPERIRKEAQNHKSQ